MTGGSFIAPTGQIHSTDGTQPPATVGERIKMIWIVCMGVLCLIVRSVAAACARYTVRIVILKDRDKRPK